MAIQSASIRPKTLLAACLSLPSIQAEIHNTAIAVATAATISVKQVGENWFYPGTIGIVIDDHRQQELIKSLATLYNDKFLAALSGGATLYEFLWSLANKKIVALSQIHDQTEIARTTNIEIHHDLDLLSRGIFGVELAACIVFALVSIVASVTVASGGSVAAWSATAYIRLLAASYGVIIDIADHWGDRPGIINAIVWTLGTGYVSSNAPTIVGSLSAKLGSTATVSGLPSIAGSALRSSSTGFKVIGPVSEDVITMAFLMTETGDDILKHVK
nr:hypothetical protein [Polymorphobacter sp.]